MYMYTSTTKLIVVFHPAPPPPLPLSLHRWIGYSGAYLTAVLLPFYSFVLWILLSYLQRFTLNALLVYKGFMFEPRG